MTLKAYSQIRSEPHYRRNAFITGLRAVGYEVLEALPRTIEPGDALIIWNQYWDKHDLACRFEAAGARVFVAENGYIGRDADGIQHYAIARSGHNGSGLWSVGSTDRLDALGLQLQPFQDNRDGHILVCGQRGIGSPTMASPAQWHMDVAKRLKAFTGREIRIRFHPEDRGAPKNTHSLDEDLAGAWACVIWSSSSGVKALVQGIPVFYEAPHWVCQYAGQRIGEIGNPWRNEENRRIGLNDMAWAQWSIAEIAAGIPFDVLLSPRHERSAVTPLEVVRATSNGVTTVTPSRPL